MTHEVEDPFVGNGPNTVSNNEVSECFAGPHRAPGENSGVPLGLLFVYRSELTEFATEHSEFSLPKQYSRNSIPPVSYLAFPQDFNPEVLQSGLG